MRFAAIRRESAEPWEIAYRPLVSRPEVHVAVKTAVYVWTMPTSAVAAPLAVVNHFAGGETILRDGVLEIHGPWVSRFLSMGPLKAAAMTLGHVVLNVDDHARRRYRDHELVHVRQAERWGPLFLPLYLGLSVWTWRRTGHGYWDHPWEVEARDRSGI